MSDSKTAECKPAYGAPTWIEIPAEDVSRAREFYTAVLGWEYQPAQFGMDVNDMSIIKFPSERLNNIGFGGAISRVTEKKTARAASHDGPVIFHHVECVDATAEKVKKLGLEVVKERSPAGPTGWQLTVRDTEGNLVGLYSDRKPTAE